MARLGLRVRGLKERLLVGDITLAIDIAEEVYDLSRLTRESVDDFLDVGSPFASHGATLGGGQRLSHGCADVVVDLLFVLPFLVELLAFLQLEDLLISECGPSLGSLLLGDIHCGHHGAGNIECFRDCLPLSGLIKR